MDQLISRDAGDNDVEGDEIEVDLLLMRTNPQEKQRYLMRNDTRRGRFDHQPPRSRLIVVFSRLRLPHASIEFIHKAGSVSQITESELYGLKNKY